MATHAEGRSEHGGPPAPTGGFYGCFLWKIFLKSRPAARAKYAFDGGPDGVFMFPQVLTIRDAAEPGH